MRRLAIAVIAAGAFVAGTAVTAACTNSGTPAHTTAERSITAPPGRCCRGPRYYLSLGDSLAQGVQPDAAAAEPARPPAATPISSTRRSAARRPGLRLVKLGCSGETSWTMIRGGICRYPAGSQLAAARQFLRAHRGHVALVTIDIGANDPNSCYLHARLSKLPALHGRAAAADRRATCAPSCPGCGRRAARHVQLIGMNYYVPELAQWRHGRTGQELAVLIERLVNGYNILLSAGVRRLRRAHGERLRGLPQRRLRRPGAAARPRPAAAQRGHRLQADLGVRARPQGPNEHANDLGYAIMAALSCCVVPAVTPSRPVPRPAPASAPPAPRAPPGPPSAPRRARPAARSRWRWRPARSLSAASVPASLLIWRSSRASSFCPARCRAAAPGAGRRGRLRRGRGGGGALRGAQLQVLLDAAGQEGELAADQRQHVVSDPLQEVPVMADRHHRARPPVQQVLQLGEGLDVQVVGRLVQQQDVGLARAGAASAAAGGARRPTARRPAPTAGPRAGPAARAAGWPTAPASRSAPTRGPARRPPGRAAPGPPAPAPGSGSRAGPCCPAPPCPRCAGTGRGVTGGRRRPAGRPAISRSSVVLPLPLTPTTPTRSPGPSCQVTWSSSRRCWPGAGRPR